MNKAVTNIFFMKEQSGTCLNYHNPVFLDQDMGERFQRRSNMLLFLKQQLEDLNIGYQLPSQEITVTGIPMMKAV
jgi:hypothetical protein